MERVRAGTPGKVAAMVLACAALALAGCSGAGEPPSGPQDSGARPPASSAPPLAQGAGDPAEWKLLSPDDVTPESITLRLGVSRIGCAGGVTGEVLAPQVSIQAARITIRTEVAPLPDGANDCQGNDFVPVTVELQEPVGNRELFDALCLDSARLTHSYCMDGGVRWRP